MDVLAPSLVWVNGACYRFFESNIWPKDDCSNVLTEETEHIKAFTDYVNVDERSNRVSNEFSVEEQTETSSKQVSLDECPKIIDTEVSIDCKDSGEKREFEDVRNDNTNKRTQPIIQMVTLPNGKFKHSFHVRQRFFGCLIGQYRSTLSRIESKSRAEIRFPRREEDRIVITATSRENIISARRIIDDIIARTEETDARYEAVRSERRRNESNGYRQRSGESNTKNEFSNRQKTENNSRETIVESSDERQEAAVKSSNDRLPENDRKSNGNEWKAQESSLSTNVESPKTLLNGKYDISGASLNANMEKVVFRGNQFREDQFRYTHFLSIPMNNEIVKTNFMKFMKALLNEPDKNPGVRLEIFRKPEKLHIPIGMLYINGDKDEAAAIKALQECKEKIIKPAIQQAGPIKITLKGVNNPIARPGIVYFKILYSNISTTNNDVYKKLMTDIVEFFTMYGFRCKPAETSYTTLMRTQFDKRNPGENFFGKHIMKEYKDYHFGEVQLTSIHISQRGQYSKDGYYMTLAKIDIP